MKINATIILGATLIAFGAVMLFIGYSSFDFTTAAIAWTSLILGALFLMFGLGKRAGKNLPNPNSSQFNHGDLELRALVQAMGSVVIADGDIKQEEVSTIATIYDQMLGLSITDNEIRNILAELNGEIDISSRLERDKGKISPTMKRIIVQSAYLVMVSDRQIDNHENEVVHKIGIALGYTPDDINDIIALVST